MTLSPAAIRSPGWYRDPDGAAHRWWDGTTWAHDVAPHAFTPSTIPANPGALDDFSPGAAPRTPAGVALSPRWASVLLAVIVLTALSYLVLHA